jgi:hypothetical protein
VYPEIFSNGNRVAILNNITSNKLIRRVNNKFLFNFQCYDEDYKTDHIIDTNQVHIGNKYFDINYFEVADNISGDVVYNVQCEHVFYRLIEPKIDRYANTGTPTAILVDLLVGTDFIIGSVDFTDPIVFAVNKNASKMQIIIELANSLGGELDFSGFILSLKSTIGQDNGYVLSTKKNIKGIKKIKDKRGKDEVVYRVDLVNIFKSDYFKVNGLENLETIGVGDIVRVIDTKIDVDVTLSVLELSKDVIDDRNLVVTLANSLDLINDEIYNDKINAVKQDETLYGVKINNELGIEIERDDLLARSIFNADEFKMQTGDGFGSYTDALFFDVLGNVYKFTGTLVGVDGEFVGTLTAATFNGGTINGTTITGGVIRTAASGERIELQGNELSTFDSSDDKDGVEISDPSGANFSMMNFYDAGTSMLQFFNRGSGNGYSLNPLNGASLNIGRVGEETEMIGDWLHDQNTARIGVRGGTAASRPANPVLYEIIVDTANKILQFWDGTDWRTFDGTIIWP